MVFKPAVRVGDKVGIFSSGSICGYLRAKTNFVGGVCEMYTRLG